MVVQRSVQANAGAFGLKRGKVAKIVVPAEALLPGTRLWRARQSVTKQESVKATGCTYRHEKSSKYVKLLAKSLSQCAVGVLHQGNRSEVGDIDVARKGTCVMPSGVLTSDASPILSNRQTSH